MANEDAYLRAILATVARQTFPAETVAEIVSKGATSDKQLRAYNLCDGSRTQAQVAKELGLDQGNFSKTLSRWVDSGIVIRVGAQGDVRPVHVYPLPASVTKKAGK